MARCKQLRHVDNFIFYYFCFSFSQITKMFFFKSTFEKKRPNPQIKDQKETKFSKKSLKRPKSLLKDRVNSTDDRPGYVICHAEK